MNDKINVLISEEEIAKRISEMAEEITKDTGDEPIVLIGILKGSIMLMADLARKLKQDVKIDFMDISSYGDSDTSSGEIKINKDLEYAIEGENVIIIEDIVDTGTTMSYLLDHLREKKPASLKLCTLLDKPENRRFDVKCDYIGFEIPNKFVVGYGLDYAQKYRNLPYIGCVDTTEK
ncbi:MAG: hypoxanthine phosphoribosyltransferase [Firmicutes bacterium]|nr:hypoxanthine phosphoribosyltransferase [Bacillota bacterium]